MEDNTTVGRMVEHAAKRFGDKPFVTGPRGTMTFGELEERSNRAARAWERLGVTKGARVALWSENSPEFLVAWMGLAKLGAPLVAVHNRFNEKEAEQVIRHSRPLVLATGREHFDAGTHLARRLRGVQHLLLEGENGNGESVAESWLKERPDPVEGSVTSEDVLSIIYTSGTTGAPKGVMQSHRTYVLTGEAYPWWLGLTEKDRLYVCLPLSHINAQAYSTMAALSIGCSLALVPRFSVSGFWADIRSYGATAANLIGSMLVLLARMEETQDDAGSPLRLIYSGAVGRLPPAERTRLETRYGVRLLTGMGMSETTFGFVQPLDSAPRMGSVGKPRGHFDPEVPSSEVRIVNEDHVDVATGESGEILLRNAAMFSGYWDAPELTSESLVDGWFSTGDLAYVDDEGYYFFVDRKKDVIRRRGENVSSVEVERNLEAHPGVLEAAVVGIASELLDEDVVAFVRINTNALVTAEELWEWLDARLAAFKVPEYIKFVEELPRTRTLKIAKDQLRVRVEDDGSVRRRERR